MARRTSAIGHRALGRGPSWSRDNEARCDQSTRDHGDTSAEGRDETDPRATGGGGQAACRRAPCRRQGQPLHPVHRQGGCTDSERNTRLLRHHPELRTEPAAAGRQPRQRRSRDRHPQIRRLASGPRCRCRQRPGPVHPGRDARQRHVRGGLRLLRHRARALHREAPRRPAAHHAPRLRPDGHQRCDDADAAELPRSDHRRSEGQAGPRQVHQQAADRTRREPLPARGHHGHGSGTRSDRTAVHAEPRDPAPSRRRDPVDQRRHAASVDNTGQ